MKTIERLFVALLVVGWIFVVGYCIADAALALAKDKENEG
jgi:hypothetical protein